MIISIIIGIVVYLIGVALAYISSGVFNYCLYRYDKNMYDREKAPPVFIALSFAGVVFNIITLFALMVYALPDPIKLFKKDKKDD